MAPGTLARHGTQGRYKLGCRCEPCRAVKAAAYRRSRERRLAPKLPAPATGGKTWPELVAEWIEAHEAS